MTIREKFRVEPESSGPTVKKAAGREAKLCYLGHLLTENRNAWVIDTQLIQVTGRADHEAALAMVEKLPVWRPLTRCADKVYEITALRASCATIGSRRTWRESQGTATDRRTSRHPEYLLSQQRHKRIEEALGWLKTNALLRKIRRRGVARVGLWTFTYARATHNIVRTQRTIA